MTPLMKHSRKNIPFLCLILLAAMTLMTACKGSSGSVAEKDFPESTPVETNESTAGAFNALDTLEITLPAGMERTRISDSQEIIQTGNATIGGVFLLECDESIFDDVLNFSDSLMPLVFQAMEDIVPKSITWHMGESSLYGLYEYNWGNEDGSEYIAYVVKGYSACYVFWFDRGQISDEDETEIMQSVHSEDITDDLNKISSEDYMAAMGEKIDSGEYRFDVSLPEGMAKEPTADDGALFYRNGQMIGGYKTVHFEKGILPAVHDNRNLIVERLREYVKDQIDLSGFDGEITDESLITAVFTSENEEYSHFILPYGQIGTQYDVWLDTKSLDQATVSTILMGAGLVKNG